MYNYEDFHFFPAEKRISQEKFASSSTEKVIESQKPETVGRGRSFIHILLLVYV